MSDAGSGETMLDSLFSTIDSKDTEVFLNFLTGDAEFRFGSNPAVSGQDAIREAVDGFLATIAGSTHRLINTLQENSTLVCEGEVTYHKLDGSDLSLPFTNVFEMQDKLIRVYKIYIDIGPLYAE